MENCNTDDRIMKRNMEIPLSRAICLLARDIQNVADRILRSYGVTQEQLYVMECLAEEDVGYQQNEICRLTKKTPANITRILDRLESKSLVSRKASPLDRRAYIIVLTGRGRSLLRKANAAMIDFSAKLCAEIDLESQDIARGAMDVICRNIKQMSMKPMIKRPSPRERTDNGEQAS